ncbi:ATP-dependent RNA helicase DEAH11 [Colletotrichum spinosum]|uniref:ATP-dependent RNA helicase DEAH11 n=1 Tax=Colletotrichum spinosum TaxID=1347390 RepID=A0A4R8Q8N9_9PEZI|nr:ATP-dependent RNA helicase DEAH11 [Colletotrichum spinosum]
MSHLLCHYKGGMTVVHDGVRINDIAIATECSAVELDGLPDGTTEESVRQFLAHFAPNVAHAANITTTKAHSGLVSATILVRDQRFSGRLLTTLAAVDRARLPWPGVSWEDSRRHFPFFACAAYQVRSSSCAVEFRRSRSYFESGLVNVEDDLKELGALLSKYGPLVQGPAYVRPYATSDDVVVRAAYTHETDALRALLYMESPYMTANLVHQSTVEMTKETMVSLYEPLSNVEKTLADGLTMQTLPTKSPHWCMGTTFSSTNLHQVVEVRERVRRIIHEHSPMVPQYRYKLVDDPDQFERALSQYRNEEATCPVCTCPAEEPVWTQCGHAFCGDCFTRFWQSEQTWVQGQGGLACCGTTEDGAVCNEYISLRALRRQVSDQMPQIIAMALRYYLRRKARHLKECPTPGCGLLFRRKVNGTQRCPGCLKVACLGCDANHSVWEPCDQGVDEELSRAMGELDIRACPNCQTGIEKREGCNHMECTSCYAHICWQCMDVSDTSNECYHHMIQTHGTIGEGYGLFHPDGAPMMNEEEIAAQYQAMQGIAREERERREQAAVEDEQVAGVEGNVFEHPEMEDGKQDDPEHRDIEALERADAERDDLDDLDDRLVDLYGIMFPEEDNRRPGDLV